MQLIIGSREILCLMAILSVASALPTTDASAQDPAGAPIILALERLQTVNRTASLVNGEVQLDARAGSGLAWVGGIALNEGCLSLDVLGSNEFGRSFVGIAFRGLDQDSYDVVYVRPFVFRSDNPEYVRSGLQYMSMPDHSWPVLRERSPGIYETSIGSTPSPKDWVHLVVRFRAGRMQAFVNGAAAPQLDVPLLTERNTGRVALWVGNNSSGAFRDLRDCT